MSSLPPLPAGHYLGKLCKRHHDWLETGKSLRTVSNHTCLDCKIVHEASYIERAGQTRAKTRYDKKRIYVDAIKLARGCIDCGYNAHPAALHFDHLPGSKKVAIIARMCTSTSMATLNAEIAKCEVVCANCHAIRTVERRH